VRPIDLHELTDDGVESKLVLDLTKPDGTLTGGTVTILTQFLNTEGNESRDAALLSVKLITVRGLALTTQHPFKIRVRVLNANCNENNAVAEGTTAVSRTVSLRYLTEPLKRSCIQLSKLGHTAQVIADVLNVELSQVEDCLTENALKCDFQKKTEVNLKERKAAKEKQTKRLDVMYPLFEEILHLLVPTCKRWQCIRLTLLDKNGARLGDATVGMDGLLDSKTSDIRGPFYLHSNVEILGSMRLTWLRKG